MTKPVETVEATPLLPCPLCDSTDLKLRDIAGWELDCLGCELSLVLADDPSREGLIARWNTRVNSYSATQTQLAGLREALAAAVPEDEDDWIEGSDVGSWCFFCRAYNEDMYKIVHRDDCAARAALQLSKEEK